MESAPMTLGTRCRQRGSQLSWMGAQALGTLDTNFYGCLISVRYM